MNEPINITVGHQHVMVSDLTSYVDDMVLCTAFLRYRGTAYLAPKRLLGTKLIELRRSATAYLESSEANAATILEVVGQCRTILAPFTEQAESTDCAKRMLVSLDNVERRLARTTTAGELTVSAGTFIVPGR